MAVFLETHPEKCILMTLEASKTFQVFGLSKTMEQTWQDGSFSTESADKLEWKNKTFSLWAFSHPISSLECLLFFSSPYLLAAVGHTRGDFAEGGVSWGRV